MKLWPIVVSLLLGNMLHAGEEVGLLREAYVHRQKGRYAEAKEVLTQLFNEGENRAALAIELSHIQESLGEWEGLTDQLQDAVKLDANSPNLLARLAEVYFRQGRYAEARKTLDQVFKLDDQHPQGHLVLADLYTETGQIEKALDNYLWFVRFYNRSQPKDAKTLELVARGSLQYARWKSSSQILKFVINTVCPDMIKADEHYWQAHQLAGELLLEKYNRAQAIPELKLALEINPRATDVLVALGTAAYQKYNTEEAESYADQALKINPHHVPACWLKADLAITAGKFEMALNAVKIALEINPHDQRTRARQAAIFWLQEEPLSIEDMKHLLSNLRAIEKVEAKYQDRFARIVIDVAKRNPHPGYFLSILAETLESRRKYDIAEIVYEYAIQSMPQLSGPKTSLGMLYMRVGKTEEAARLLDNASLADPFHVRVSNMRKVLKLLDGYETITTDHFVIRVDSEFDKVLGRYMADYLEGIYPELTKQFDFEPPHRTHFEIYNQAKGLSAHQWFSARMVGLPWIQTIGASTGVMVALASPTAAEEPYNWARVLKHEFVHVITLQQTNFNIPHWFTEALAVTAEGGSGPEIWNDLLVARVPQADIRSLDELNDGFTNPKSPADWQFAYCQSRLYARYMIEQYGQQTIPKLLDAYRRNESTKQAIPKVFGVDVEMFEKGYRDFLNQLVKEIQGSVPDVQFTLAELEQAYRKSPDHPETLGKYARALLEVRKWSEAKTLAEKAREIDATEPHAALTLATLKLKDKDTLKAIEYLESALTAPPHREVLELLARLKLSQEAYPDAQKLYELGRKTFPHSSTWLKGLAAVALRTDDQPALKLSLKALAERVVDNPAYPKKLAELSLNEQNYQAAIHYSLQTLYIDVMDAETHTRLGEAYEKSQSIPEAIREYQVTLQLAPTTIDAELGLARCYLKNKQEPEAAELLKTILKREPNHSAAQSLLDQLLK